MEIRLRYIRWFAVFSVALSLMLPCIPSVVGAVYDNEVDLNIRGDPNLVYEDEFDITNQSDMRAKVKSEQMFEDIGFQGTYYGPLFHPGQFKYYYDFKNNPDDTFISTNINDYNTIEDFIYEIEINITLSIGPEIMMNGATEWWVSLPVVPDPELIVDQVDPDSVKGDQIWMYSSFTMYIPDNTQTSGYRILDPNFSLSGIYANNIFYAFMPVPINPTIDTITEYKPIRITFSLTKYLDDPVLYITDEVLGRPKNFDWSAHVAGEDTVALLNGDKAETPDEIGFESIRIDGWGKQVESTARLFDPHYRYMPSVVSLGYAIVFVQGIGKHNLYGQQVTFEENVQETIIFVGTEDFSSLALTGEYLSFYIPFICSEKLYIEDIRIQVDNFQFDHFPNPATGTYIWNYVTDGGGVRMDFRDFILFSAQVPLFNSPVGPSEYLFMITFYQPQDTDVTFLFNWYEDEPTSLFYGGYGNAFIKIDGNITSQDSSTMEVYYGALQHTVHFTDGIWVVQEVLEPGQYGPPYTKYYYPKVIYVGDFTYSLEGTNGNQKQVKDSAYYWRQAMKAFEGASLTKPGLLIDGIKYSLIATALTFYEGGKTIYGWIKSGISQIWDGLKYVGEWLWKGIMKIVDAIISIIEFIEDYIVPILELGLIVMVIWLFLVAFGFYGKVYRKLFGEAI